MPMISFGSLESPPALVDQIAKLSGDDGELQEAYRSYYSQSTDDLIGLIHAGNDYNDKKIVLLESCSDLLKIKKFLSQQLQLTEQERGAVGFLPVGQEQFLLQLPDKMPNLSSWDWTYIHNFSRIMDVSFPTAEEINAGCGQQESEAHLFELQDYIANKSLPFSSLYEGSPSYAQMKEILSPSAIEQLMNSSRKEDWNRMKDRVEATALNVIWNKQKNMYGQILEHLRNLCQVEGHPGNHTYTISNCRAVTPSSTSPFYAAALLGVLVVGSLYALWSARSQEKADPAAELSSMSKEIRRELFTHLNNAIKSRGQYERLQGDYARLEAMADQGRIKEEWSTLSPEFQRLLSACLRNSLKTPGYLDAMRSQISQVGVWLQKAYPVNCARGILFFP